MSSISVDVVTAEGNVFSGNADLITLQASKGEITILPNHVDFVTIVEPGELRIVENKKEMFIAVGGGFLEIQNNIVTLLADSAERDSDIDLERATEAEARAKERIESLSEDVNTERALGSLLRARVRTKIARRRRTRQNSTRGSSQTG